MKIRQSSESDRAEISGIHLNAFGQEEGPEIAELVSDLLNDVTAVPFLSLVAETDQSLLGHPGCYPKFGFETAGVHGLMAPYPIPSENADAWMVQDLKTGLIGNVEGRVKCSEVLSQPQYWRE